MPAATAAKPLALPLYVLTLLTCLCLVGGYWYWQGRSVILPDVAGVNHKLQCASYSPFAKDQSPLVQPFTLRPEVIEADLALLAQYFSCIRTYSMEGMENLPEVAARHGLTVMLGAWVGPDQVHTAAEIERLVSAANRYPDVVTAVIIGNEVLLRKELSGPKLAALIRSVKPRVQQPVTYADVWEFWNKHPEVAPEVDFITIHLLPYWEDEPTGIDAAIANVARVRAEFGQQFAPKPVFIGETGWPSAGRQRETAVPSRVNEARFMREFVTLAEHNGWQYNLIEAFDQPWKRNNEGAVGGYWGLFDADRQDKAILAGAVSNLPDYPRWLSLSVLLLGAGLLLLGRPQNVRAALLGPLLAATAGLALSAWWVQASYASRDLWEWLWAALVTLLNGAVLAHAMLCLSARNGWRQSLWQPLQRAAPALLLGAGFIGALLSLQLLLDARYRLFSPGAIAVPALWFALQPVATSRPRARLLLTLLLLAAPGVLWQETLTNTQALAWVAAELFLALALWRSLQISPPARWRPTRAALLTILALGLWVATCYGLRYELMEDPRWVALCEPGASLLWCELRASLGLLIHWRVLVWLALGWLALSLLLRRTARRRAALVALFCSVPALVLYHTTPGSLVLLLSLLSLLG